MCPLYYDFIIFTVLILHDAHDLCLAVMLVCVVIVSLLIIIAFIILEAQPLHLVKLRGKEILGDRGTRTVHAARRVAISTY